MADEEKREELEQSNEDKVEQEEPAKTRETDTIAQDDVATLSSTFGADAAGLTPGAPNGDEQFAEALDEVKPEERPEQDFAQVADRLEEQTAGLERHPDQTLRTKDGKVAYAPPGSYDAAASGVQQDASGHFESANKTNSTQSGSRV
jgi:hypothetical protein